MSPAWPVRGCYSDVGEPSTEQYCVSVGERYFRPFTHGKRDVGPRECGRIVHAAPHHLDGLPNCLLGTDVRQLVVRALCLTAIHIQGIGYSIDAALSVA